MELLEVKMQKETYYFNLDNIKFFKVKKIKDNIFGFTWYSLEIENEILLFEKEEEVNELIEKIKELKNERKRIKKSK